MLTIETPRERIRTAFLTALLLLVIYAYIYQAEPLDAFWNDLLLNLITALTSLFSTIAAWLIMQSYEKEDAVRRIWLYFVIGFLLWTAAEVVWGYLNITLGDVPTPSLADLLWIFGYFFFGMGFIKQYEVLFSTPRQKKYTAFGIAILASVGITYLIQQLWGIPGDFGNYVNLLYPVADFAVLLTAIGLVYTFRQGVFGRPWLAMAVFTLSDGLYAWLDQSGGYAYLAESGDYASMLVDTLYMASYLVIAIGFFAQYLIVKYGPWAFSSPSPAE